MVQYVFGNKRNYWASFTYRILRAVEFHLRFDNFESVFRNEVSEADDTGKYYSLDRKKIFSILNQEEKLKAILRGRKQPTLFERRTYKDYLRHGRAWDRDKLKNAHLDYVPFMESIEKFKRVGRPPHFIKVALLTHAYIESIKKENAAERDKKFSQMALILKPDGILHNLVGFYFGEKNLSFISSVNFKEEYIKATVEEYYWYNDLFQKQKRLLFRGLDVEDHPAILEIGKKIAFGEESDFQEAIELGAFDKEILTPNRIVTLYLNQNSERDNDMVFFDYPSRLEDFKPVCLIDFEKYPEVWGAILALP